MNKQLVLLDLFKFVHTEDFNNKLELRKKILWTNEQLNFRMDVRELGLIESIDDYNTCSLEELQEIIKGYIMDLVDKEDI
jgi:hypothetical protein